MPVLPVKERMEAIQFLFNAAKDRYARRVLYQWKVFFAAWGMLGLAIGLMVTQKEVPFWPALAAAVILAILTLCTFAYWFLPWTAYSDHGDKLICAYCEAHMERLLGKRFYADRPALPGWLRAVRQQVFDPKKDFVYEPESWRRSLGYKSQFMITFMLAVLLIGCAFLHLDTLDPKSHTNASAALAPMDGPSSDGHSGKVDARSGSDMAR